MQRIVIPHDGYTDRSHIVVLRMRRHDIVASRTTLVDFSALSDDVIIANISPSSRYRMIRIDGTKHFFIGELLVQALGSMVNHDTVDLFNFLNRPDKMMTLLIAHDTHRLHRGIIFGKFDIIPGIGCRDTSKFSRCFRTCQIREIRIPERFLLDTIRITKRLVRSPLGTRDDIWISVGFGESPSQFLTDRSGIHRIHRNI
jgi:hypothetical protein